MRGHNTCNDIFYRFKEAIKNINIERKLRMQASHYRNMKQGSVVIKHWQFLVQEKIHGRIYQQVAFRHYANHLHKKV